MFIICCFYFKQNPRIYHTTLVLQSTWPPDVRTHPSSCRRPGCWRRRHPVFGTATRTGTGRTEESGTLPEANKPRICVSLDRKLMKGKIKGKMQEDFFTSMLSLKCRIQIIVYYTMTLFHNQFFIILPFQTKTLYQHMQDTNIENLTLKLAYLQHTNQICIFISIISVLIWK